MANQNLVKQIQYYLSEDNLQSDEFFYKEVASNKDHYVSLKSFLNCNKIKKMGINKIQQIVAAVEDSDALQLNPQKTMLRLISLANLPEFKPKKKIKSQQKHQQIQVNPYDKIQTVIFSLSVEKEQVVHFKYIQQALLKNHNVFAVYTRFNKNEGNFAVEKKSCTPQVVEKLQKQGLKVGETQFNIKKLGQAQLNEFWQKHGHHYNGIIQNLRKTHAKKIKQQKRAKQKDKKVKQFTFGDQQYDDINKLKSLFKNILCRNPNNIPLKDKQSKLVKELLSYHDRGQQKLKGFKHFVVDVNQDYVDTRCFYIVRQDGTKEDFSVVKCIHNIEDKYAA